MRVSTQQVKRSAREAIGKATGYTKTQAEGAADKTQSTIGGVKDSARNVFKQ